MPDLTLELSWDDYVKKNAAFSKEFSLGIKKLKLDPKLQAQILALTKKHETNVKALGKKNTKNGQVDLKTLVPAYKKEQVSLTEQLNKMLKDYKPAKPDPKADPMKDKANWGKIKLEHGPFNLQFKAKVKDNKIKLDYAGAGLKLKFK